MSALIRSFPPPWRHGLLAVLLLALSSLAWSQSDPPTRVAYISALEGQARIGNTADPGAWEPATLNWPITTGSTLRLDPGTRVELDGGWLTLRLHGPADLDTSTLDDGTTQVALLDGTLSLRLRELAPGERVEVDTPQLALVATEPGEYRLDVDARAGTTRVTVHEGAATAYGDPGQPLPLVRGSEQLFSGRDLGLLANRPAPARDAFDQWVAQRDAQQESSASARYLSPGMPGIQPLDTHGDWANDPAWGPVWYPNVTNAGWAPYRDGRWAWIEPWGWTWVDDAPWGFAPFHYGRWTQIGPRWAWVPGPVLPRPVYAPALVQFFASGSGWSLSIGSGPLGAAWFPLAPGEAWRPHYHASPRYLDRINDWSHWRRPARPRSEGYFFQYRPGAISVAAAGAFERPRRGSAPRPRYRDGRVLPADWLRESRVAPPPAHARPSRERPAGRTPAPRRDHSAPVPRSLLMPPPGPQQARPVSPHTAPRMAEPIRPRRESVQPEQRPQRNGARRPAAPESRQQRLQQPPQSRSRARPSAAARPAPAARGERTERARPNRESRSPRQLRPAVEPGTRAGPTAVQRSHRPERASRPDPIQRAAPAPDRTRAQAARPDRDDRARPTADGRRDQRAERGHRRTGAMQRP